MVSPTNASRRFAKRQCICQLTGWLLWRQPPTSCQTTEALQKTGLCFIRLARSALENKWNKRAGWSKSFTVFHDWCTAGRWSSKKPVKMLYPLRKWRDEPNIILLGFDSRMANLQALLLPNKPVQAAELESTSYWVIGQALYLSALKRLDWRSYMLCKKSLRHLNFLHKNNRKFCALLWMYCHLGLLFIPYNLDALPLDYGLSD